MTSTKKVVRTATVPADRRGSGITRQLVGNEHPVLLDAVFHVPSVHPRTPGPWSDEADKLAWTDAATGYACIIRRSPVRGHLCGYVAVPPGHPLFGMPAQALVGLHLSVHNGLSYAKACEAHEPESRAVCHIPATRPEEVAGQVLHRDEGARDGHDDAWWFGFDCDGPSDIVPRDPMQHAQGGPFDGIVERVYRDEAFLLEEVARLAVQLKAVEDGRDPVEVVVPRRLDRGDRTREDAR